MKNSPSTESRFTCRVVRGCLSIFGDTSGPAPRGFGASHVATCEDCQQFFGACDELAVALKRDAVRQWRDAPSSLEQNIMRAVRLSTKDSAGSVRRARSAWLSFGAVAACALAVAVVYQNWAPAGATLPTRGSTVAADSATTGAMEEIVASVPSNLFAEMQPKAEALLQQDPLQNEVDAIASDARKAVGFLARNFLPANTTLVSSGE